MTTTSYRAVQASKPGRLEVVERELTAPPPGKVRIRVEACGVCHSDSGTGRGPVPHRLAARPRPRARRADRRAWFRCPGLGGWAARGRRVPWGLLRLLRVLPQW